MPDEAYGQVDYSDKIAARRQERADKANPEQAEERKAAEGLAELKSRLAALEAWRDNLQGTNGITVTDGIISYTQPAGTINIICNGDGTMSGTLTF